MAHRIPPRKVTYFEPVVPRLARNTVIESTFDVGRRFPCTMRVDCGELDPGAVIRPAPGEWHPAHARAARRRGARGLAGRPQCGLSARRADDRRAPRGRRRLSRERATGKGAFGSSFRARSSLPGTPPQRPRRETVNHGAIHKEEGQPLRGNKPPVLSGPHVEESPTDCRRKPRLVAGRGSAAVGIRPRAVCPAEVVVVRHTGALPPQLFHARRDRREIVCGAGTGHVSSLVFCRASVCRAADWKIMVNEARPPKAAPSTP